MSERQTPRGRGEPLIPLKERTYFCAICTAPFTPSKWNQKTCCEAHANELDLKNDRARRKKKAKEQGRERLCIIEECRKPFRPRNDQQICCSDECRALRKSRLRKQQRAEKHYASDVGSMAGASVSSAKTDALLAEVHKRGYYALKADASQQEQRFSFDLFDGDTTRFALVGDTHYCSKQQQHTHFCHFYHYAHEQGITEFFHTGDLFNGDGKQHKGQEFENFIHGEDEQVEYVAAQYPKIKGCTTHIIGGSHDYSFFKSSGSDVIKRLADRRDDMEYLGYAGAYIDLSPTVDMYLCHPDGGTSYALSYQAQKKVENFTPENKPRICVFGHYHRALYMPAYRNVETVLAPCFQSQTPFLKAKAVFPIIGAWIIELTVNENGLARFKPELIRYYVPIESDY
jgi:hypothetical protein